MKLQGVIGEVKQKIMRSITLNQNRLAWSVDELTSALGVSQGFLRKLMRSKELPSKKIGRRVVILDRDLQQFLSKADA